MRAGFDRTGFDKYGSATAKKRKRDVDASLCSIHRRRDDCDDRGGPSGQDCFSGHGGPGRDNRDRGGRDDSGHGGSSGRDRSRDRVGRDDRNADSAAFDAVTHDLG
ncbi:hypothetical protein AaE_013152, partial [Aphanomyces astaci]